MLVLDEGQLTTPEDRSGLNGPLATPMKGKSGGLPINLAAGRLSTRNPPWCFYVGGRISPGSAPG